MDKNQQYSRRNCLLIHGVKENNGENTDTVVMNVIKEHLDVDLNEISIDRSHRIGKPRDDEGRPRPIILKLVRHNDKMKVFRVKKKLKGKNISVTESLTKFRVQKLKEAKERYGQRNKRTNDGKIFFKESENDFNILKLHSNYLKNVFGLHQISRKKNKRKLLSAAFLF